MVGRLGRHGRLSSFALSLALVACSGSSTEVPEVDGSAPDDVAAPSIDGNVAPPGEDSSPGVGQDVAQPPPSDDGGIKAEDASEHVDATTPIDAGGDASGGGGIEDATLDATSDASDATLGAGDAADATASVDAADAATASASLSAPTVSFGLANCGDVAPADQTLSVANNGTAPLTLSAALGTSNFGVSPTSATVAPRAAQLFTLTSLPVPVSATAGSAIADTLTLTTNDPSQPTLSVPVSVVPQGVTLSLNPTAAAFGLEQLNAPATPIALSLVNVGNASATVTLTAPIDPEFGIAPTSALIVAPGSPASLSASFTPTTTSATTTSAGIGLPPGTFVCGTSVTSIPMSGQGAIGALTLSATSLQFGASGLWPCNNTAPPSQTITIGNSGTSAFDVMSLSFGGASSVPYTYTLPSGVSLPASVAPGGSLVLTIDAPIIPGITAVPGNFSDALTITTDLPSNGSQVVNLGLGAAGAVLAFDTASIPFNAVPSGTTTNATFHVLNSGNAGANVTLAAATVGGGSLFGVAPTTAIAVAAGGGPSAQASFTAPTDTNVHNGAIAMTVGSTDVVCQPLPSPVALSGTAQNGGIALSSNALAFGNNGNVNCGTQAAAQTVTVTNSGNVSIDWWWSLGQGASSPYTVTPSCTQASPCAIGPGSANAVTLSIQPAKISATAGIVTYNDTLAISSNAVGDTGHSISLAEQSYGAILAFSPADENFGLTPIGTTPSSPIQVLNTGNAPVAVTLAKAGSSEFSLSGTSVNVGASTPGAFTVKFAPGTDTTPVSGSVGLTAPANSLCAAPPAPLTLEGQGSSAVISVTPSLNFNAGANGNGGIGVSCGATGPTENVVVANSGTLTANVTALTLGRGTTSPFNAPTVTLPLAILPGKSVTIPVVPKQIPTTASPPGNFSDTLTVTTNATGDSPHSVALGMSAAGAVLALVPTNIGFGATTVNTQRSSQLTLTNSGNLDAPVTFSANNSVFTFSTGVKAQAQSQALPYAYFTPTGATSYAATGTMTVAAGTPTCGTLPGGLTFSGTGTAGATVTVAPTAVAFGPVNCGSPAPSNQTVTMTNNTAGSASLPWTAALSGTGNEASFFSLSASSGSVAGNGGLQSFQVIAAPLTSTSGLTSAEVLQGLTATLTVTVGTYTYTLTVTEKPAGAIPNWNTPYISIARGGVATVQLNNPSYQTTSFTLTSSNATFPFEPSATPTTTVSPSYYGASNAVIKDTQATGATAAQSTNVTAVLTTPTDPLCGPLPAALVIQGN